MITPHLPDHIALRGIVYLDGTNTWLDFLFENFGTLPGGNGNSLPRLALVTDNNDIFPHSHDVSSK